MRLQLTIITLLILCSCGTTTSNEITNSTRTSDFRLLIKNLNKLDVGYTYDPINQDAENSYTPDKNGDSLFYTPLVPILGVLPDNGEIYSIIHFVPGDDLYPILRTFTKEGIMVDEKNIVYGECAGWDCDFDECEEQFEVINDTTIQDVLILLATPCDTLGNKLSHLTTKEIRQRTLTIDRMGQIRVTEKIE